MKRLVLFLTFSAAVAVPTRAATISLAWTGSNGYTMDGLFSFSSALSGPITGSNLDSFVINGYLNGNLLGSWNLTSGFAGYLFNFNFDATTDQFFVGGHSTSSTGQLWNTSASATTCPNPGFGFGSGAAAQGICLNGSLVIASFIDVASSTLTANVVVPPEEVVPEPATWSTIGLGLVGLALSKKAGPRIQRWRAKPPPRA